MSSFQRTADGQFIEFQCVQDPHYDFLSSPPSLESLNSSQYSEPTIVTFGASPELYTSSTSPSPLFLASQELSTSPTDESPPSQYQPESPHKPATRLRSGNRVPRPRNAFMLFRSEFWAKEKISPSVEHDHRHISRIIGHCWNQLPEEEKAQWRRKAEQEKLDHLQKYPGYRFSPTSRTKKAVKRKVKRNGEEELLRCRRVAELLLAGKEGEELNTAVKSMGLSQEDLRPEQAPSKPVDTSASLVPSSSAMQPQSQPIEQWNYRNLNSSDVPIFRSPLIPPTIAAVNATTQPNYINKSPSKHQNYQISAHYREDTPASDPSWNACEILEHVREQYPPNGDILSIPPPSSDFYTALSQFANTGYQYSQPPGYVEQHSLDIVYQQTPSTTHPWFQNSFNYSLNPVPHSQPGTLLDPLQWDLAHFTTA